MKKTHAVKRDIHLIPKGSLFRSQLKPPKGAEIIEYANDPGLWAAFVRLFVVAKYLFIRRGNVYLHWVPNYILFLLLPFKKKYNLHYWGGDIYPAMYGTEAVTWHCVRRVEKIRHNHVAAIPRAKYFKTLKMLIFLRVFGAADTVELNYKQYRVLRRYYFRLFGKNPDCRWVHNGLYGDSDEALHANNSMRRVGASRALAIHVLVSHSCTADVNVADTAIWLREISQKIAVNATAFIAYGFQDQAHQESLRTTYYDLLSDFCADVQFETRLVDHGALTARLRSIDLAFFSAYRDEGCGTLALLLKTGGFCAFNKRSFNYHIFRKDFPERVMTHEEASELSRYDWIRIIKERRSH